MESRPVHSIFTPKEVITEVTPQGVTSVTNWVKIHLSFREYIEVDKLLIKYIQKVSKELLMDFPRNKVLQGDVVVFSSVPGEKLYTPPVKWLMIFNDN